MVEDHRQDKSQLSLCESLTQTDAPAAEERIEPDRISLLSRSSQQPLVTRFFHVEAFRFVAVGLWPLLRICVHLGHVYDELNACGDLDSVFSLADGDILIENTGNPKCYRRVDSQSLIVALLEIVETHHGVIVKVFEIWFTGLKSRADLSHQFLFEVRVFGHVVNRVDGCELDRAHPGKEEQTQLLCDLLVVTFVLAERAQNRKQVVAFDARFLSFPSDLLDESLVAVDVSFPQAVCWCENFANQLRKEHHCRLALSIECVTQEIWQKFMDFCLYKLTTRVLMLYDMVTVLSSNQNCHDDFGLKLLREICKIDLSVTSLLPVFHHL